MANYVGSARSNHFRVRDGAAFLDWVGTLPGVVAREDGASPDRFALLVEDGEDGSWPAWRHDEEGEDEEIDLYTELAGHLAEGEVVVLQEVGAEKLRYLVGYAVAVNHCGEKLAVSIDDIYEKVREAGWGSNVSTATY
jgi:hypothetical protein